MPPGEQCINTLAAHLNTQRQSPCKQDDALFPSRSQADAAIEGKERAAAALH